MRTIILYIFLSISFVSLAQTSRSYMEQEIVTQTVQGPLSEVPQHAGTWVEWDSTDNNILMMDGTKWKRIQSTDGLIHYRYVSGSGITQPYTKPIETIFNKDFSKMKIRYEFGPMGMPIQMVGIYVCLGDGKQLAEDWINMPDEE